MPFQIIRNDITKVKADAIVNSANPKPMIGSGTDSAIYAAAGAEKLLAKREKIGDIAPGNAAVTPAYRLPAKHIIHTVGPIWVDGRHGEREILHSCYAHSLALAADLKAKSVAFPLIATGVYGFPKDEALNIALAEIGRFLLTHDMTVLLVVFDRSAFELSASLVGEIEAFIDDHGVNTVREAEFSFYPVSSARRSPNAMRWRREDVSWDLSEALPSETAARPAEREFGSLESSFSAPLFDGASIADEADGWPSEPTLCDAAKASIFSRPDAGTAPRRRQEAELRTLDAPSPVSRHDAGRSPSLPRETKASAPSPMLNRPPRRPVEDASLEDVLKHTGETFQQKLLHLIDDSGMTDAAVYKKANIDRRVFSRMRSRKDYKPKKATAVAFAIALELEWNTMKDLLSRAGIAFSPSDQFDLIIQYFVTHHNYDIFEINAALFKYGQPILGEA